MHAHIYRYVLVLGVWEYEILLLGVLEYSVYSISGRPNL